jgi:hypothetical protein
MAMLKLIAGFLLGVVTTIVLVYWFAEESPMIQAILTGHSSVPEKTVEVKQVFSTSTDDKVSEPGGESINTSTLAEAERKISNASAPDRSVSNVESVTSKPQSAAVGEPVANAESPAQRSSTSSINEDYPPEIADMIENNVDKELQARYESDDREESWAIYMEGQLTAYFAQKSALAQFYISLIDCRTSICAVHALGYGPDALTLWNTATADLISQPWFEFNSMSMNRRNPQPDILGIVLILTKKPPE